MRATIYTCTVQSGKHSYQIIDLHSTYTTVIKLGSQCSSDYVLNKSICTSWANKDRPIRRNDKAGMAYNGVRNKIKTRKIRV